MPELSMPEIHLKELSVPAINRSARRRRVPLVIGGVTIGGLIVASLLGSIVIGKASFRARLTRRLVGVGAHVEDEQSKRNNRRTSRLDRPAADLRETPADPTNGVRPPSGSRSVTGRR